LFFVFLLLVFCLLLLLLLLLLFLTFEPCLRARVVFALALCCALRFSNVKDKILQSTSHENEVSVTNDGATILKSIHLANPAAKVLVDISKTQDDEVGDGTTSVCVLTAELLREADVLVNSQHLHPQTIIAGWRKASKVALEALTEIAIDNSSDPGTFVRHECGQVYSMWLMLWLANDSRTVYASLWLSGVIFVCVGCSARLLSSYSS
jgi:TCP-1/cpn60 chaperonin family